MSIFKSFSKIKKINIFDYKNLNILYKTIFYFIFNEIIFFYFKTINNLNLIIFDYLNLFY